MATQKNAQKPSKVQDPMAHRPDYIPQESYDIPKDEKGFFPGVKVLQPGSPECTKGHEKHIKGATAGQLLLNFKNDPMLVDGDEGFQFVVLGVKKRYVEYRDRDSGGGFVASYDSREDMEASFTKGNEMQVSIDYLVMTEFEDQVAVVSFNTPTKLSVARELAGHIEKYSTMSGVRYRLGSRLQTNKKNQSFYNFTVEPVGWLKKEEFKAIEAARMANEPVFLPGPADAEVVI